MLSSFKNHIVVRRKIFVDQVRLMLRKGREGSKLLVFRLSNMFRIQMDGENLPGST